MQNFRSISEKQSFFPYANNVRLASQWVSELVNESVSQWVRERVTYRDATHLKIDHLTTFCIINIHHLDIMFSIQRIFETWRGQVIQAWFFIPLPATRYLTTWLLATWLPDYLTAWLPDYLSTWLPATWLPHYLTTCLPDYMLSATWLPDYLTTSYLLTDYQTTTISWKPNYLRNT